MSSLKSLSPASTPPVPVSVPVGERGVEVGEPKHTPGPWAITSDGSLPIHVGAKDGRWKHVPGTLLAEVGGNLSVGTGNFQEDLANARLIAAAPEMFAVLDQAPVLIPDGLTEAARTDPELMKYMRLLAAWIPHARTALAKARAA